MSLALIALLVLWAKHAGDRRLARWTYAVAGLAAAQIALGVLLAVRGAGTSVFRWRVTVGTVASLLMGRRRWCSPCSMIDSTNRE